MKKMKRIYIKIKKYDDEKRIENDQEVLLKKEFHDFNLNATKFNSFITKIALSLIFCLHNLFFLFTLIIILVFFYIFQLLHHRL
jgi:hypothetical protein